MLAIAGLLENPDNVLYVCFTQELHYKNRMTYALATGGLPSACPGPPREQDTRTPTRRVSNMKA